MRKISLNKYPKFFMTPLYDKIIENNFLSGIKYLLNLTSL